MHAAASRAHCGPQASGRTYRSQPRASTNPRPLCTPTSRRSTPSPMPAAAATPAAPAAAAAGRDFAAASPPGLVQQLLGLPFPPFAPLIGSEAGSFAQDTITTRLPAIMDTVLADLQAEGAAAGAGPDAQQLQQQLEAAAAGVKAMQQEMPADGPLLLLQAPATLPAGHPLRDVIPVTNAAVAAWQQHTARHQQQQPPEGAAGTAPATWLQLPWLLVECYLYVRLATIIAEQPLLAASGYDPFFRQKAAALAKSLTAAADIAAAAEALLQQQQAAVVAAGCGRRQQLAALTTEDSRSRLCQILQYSLWGNKTDLSMLVDVAHLDPSSTTDVASSSANIIADDSDRLWQHLTSAAASRAAQLESSPSSVAGGPEGLAAALPRIDVILDNAGLELVSDLWLADFLVSGGWAEQVVLHGKALPWFVSDTLARDLTHLLESCAAGGSGSGEVAAAAAARWARHLQAGRWRWAADRFWTAPFPFAWMQQLAPELHADLAQSSLLIFKGDLNYRKLAHDCRWPPTTPFKTSLQGFAPTALLSLRTLKADVIAGLAEGEAAALDRLDPRWQVNGKFGVVQFDA